MNRARAKRIQTLENIKKNIDSNKGEMKKKKVPSASWIFNVFIKIVQRGRVALASKAGLHTVLTAVGRKKHPNRLPEIKWERKRERSLFIREQKDFSSLIIKKNLNFTEKRLNWN